MATSCFTHYARRRINGQVFGGRVWKPPERVWVGLSLGEANEFGLVAEPCPTLGYRRVQVANDALNWGESGNFRLNLLPVYFPAPLGNWGWVRSVFIADGPGLAGGQVIVMADLDHAVSSRPGTRPLVIPAGGIRLG